MQHGLHCVCHVCWPGTSLRMQGPAEIAAKGLSDGQSTLSTWGGRERVHAVATVTLHQAE